MIKKLFKKALIVGAVAFMSFASINAMAEEAWHKVSDQMGFNVHTVGPVQKYFASSWEEMCIDYAEKYFIPTVTCMEDGWNCYKYKDSAWGSNDNGMSCMGTAPRGDQEYGTSTFCTEGQKHPTRGVFGCFEYIECDPAKYSDPSEMPKNCSKPVVDLCDPGNYKNGVLPADCPKTEPEIKAPQCPKNPPLDPYGRPAAGAVACNGNDVKNRTFCTYLPDTFWSDTAKEIAQECLELHEIEHRNDPKGTCGKDGWMIIEDEVTRLNAEIDAYNKQLQCLRNATDRCGLNPICRLELWGETQSQSINKINYEKYKKYLEEQKTKQ